MTFKTLTHCCNGDGRPVQPPSKVLCKECLAALDKKFRDLRDTLFGPQTLEDLERGDSIEGIDE